MVIPVVYLVVLGVLFNMTMTDDYLTTAEPMFEGVGPFSINGLDKHRVERWAAVLRMLSPPILILACFTASLTYGRVKASKKKEAAKGLVKEKHRSSQRVSLGASATSTPTLDPTGVRLNRLSA